jgi:hypothetical protein
MKKALGLSLLFLLFWSGCAKEVSQPQVVQAEVIGVEFVHSKPGVLRRIYAETVLGIKTTEGIQSLAIWGIHPEIQKGKKYEIRYTKMANWHGVCLEGIIEK